MPSDYEKYLIDSLFETYSKASGFKVKDIKGKRRIGQLVKVRHEIMLQISLTTSLSSAEIAKIFKRSHKSIDSLFEKSGWIKKDEKY